jgi:hypothetical protein
VKEIQLTRGKVAIVDDEDYKWLSKHKWYAVKRGNMFYAVRKSSRVDGGQKNILMHREIMGLKPGDPDVDHRDGDGLNNQRMNLRKASKSQNAMNMKTRYGMSKFKGVSWNKRDKKWQVRIGIDGKQKHLGNYDCEEDAARAYDEKAIELFGEYARLNFRVMGRDEKHGGL